MSDNKENEVTETAAAAPETAAASTTEAAEPARDQRAASTMRDDSVPREAMGAVSGTEPAR